MNFRKNKVYIKLPSHFIVLSLALRLELRAKDELVEVADALAVDDDVATAELDDDMKEK